MSTLNSTRDGYIVGESSTTFSTARTTVGTGTANESSSSSSVFAVQFFTGKGGIHRFTRLYAHFDTSGISGTVSNATITIYGGSSTSTADVVILESSAFGGDGGTALATSDFYNEIDYTTKYSNEYATTWATGANVIPLLGRAYTDIQNNDDFTIAIVNHDRDYSNSDGSSVEGNQVDFSQHFVLTYTETASAPDNSFTYKVNGLIGAPAGREIQKIYGVLKNNNIRKVIGV
jgi:hypothetical protein